jgi:hypothetical protein
MDGIMLLVLFAIVGLDSLYRSHWKRVACDSGELMYKYQVVCLRRRFKSVRSDIFIRDNL